MQIYKWLNKEKDRFYKITIKKDGGAVILKYHWGSCISNRGGKKDVFLACEDEAVKTIEQMMKRRKSRGYELITPKTH